MNRGLLKRLVKELMCSNNLPEELICLSCLCTQPTIAVINNDNQCLKCSEPIDPYNLSDVEV